MSGASRSSEAWHWTKLRLAAQLGVAPNAIYSHFSNKAELIDSLLDSVLEEVHAPDPDAVEWERGLALLMIETRRVLPAHPGLVRHYIARSSTGPQAIRLGEVTLELLRRGGLSGRRAVHALHALLIFTLGFVAFETPRHDDPDLEARLARGHAAFRGAPAERFPNIHRGAQPLATPPDDPGFRAGLNWLLRGVAVEVGSYP